MSGHGTEHPAHDPHEHAHPHEAPKPAPSAAHVMAETLLPDQHEAPHEGEPTVAEFSSSLEKALKDAHISPDHVHAVIETASHEPNFAKAMVAASAKLAILDEHFDVDAFCEHSGFHVSSEPDTTPDLPPAAPKNVEEVTAQTLAKLYRRRLAEACRLKLHPDQTERLMHDNLIGDESETQIAYNLALHWLTEEFASKLDRSAVGRAGSEAARLKHQAALTLEAETQAREFLAKANVDLPEA